MFRAPGRVTTRLSAMTAVTGLAAAGVIGFAGVAAADGVKGTFTSWDDKGTSLALTNAKGQKVDAAGGLMKLKLDTGEELKVYCIDKENPTQGGNRYQESDWEGTWLGDKDIPAERRAKLKWVLNHSYPTVPVEELKKKAGAEGLDNTEAGAATQAAVWHFSDSVDLVPERQHNDDIVALYNYLVNNAKADDASEPKISLELDPEEKTGSPADKNGIGPFTVKTNAKGDKVEAKLKPGFPQGTTLVDKSGAEVTGPVGDKTQLYVKAPKDSVAGEATINVSGTSTLEAGRVFKAEKAKTQLLILAGKSQAKVEDESVAKWALKGAAPAFNAEEQCTDGGVQITATNSGDTPFTYTLDGKKNTVKPGETVKQLVKVGEDQTYKVAVTGEDGKVVKEFEGVLDCKTETTTGGSTGGGSSSGTVGSSGGGTTGGTTGGPASPAPANPKGPELAETGGDGGNTAAILGGAGALVVLGGGVVFLLRRRNAGGNPA